MHAIAVLLALVSAGPAPSSLDRALQQMASELVKQLPPGKTIVVRNFRNDQPGVRERMLGVDLAKQFNYCLFAAGKSHRLTVVDRHLGKALVTDEMLFRPARPDPEALLKRFQADCAVDATYRLERDRLRICELRVGATLGAKVEAAAKPRDMALSYEDYERMKEREDTPVPNIGDTLARWLVDPGNWQGAIRGVQLLDVDRRPLDSNVVQIGDYVRVRVELDSAPCYLYLFGWDVTANRVTVMFPAKYEQDNYVIAMSVVVPYSDSLAFPIKPPAGFNWVKAVVTKERLPADVVSEAFLGLDEPHLVQFGNALAQQGIRWCSAKEELWIRVK